MGLSNNNQFLSKNNKLNFIPVFYITQLQFTVVLKNAVGGVHKFCEMFNRVVSEVSVLISLDQTISPLPHTIMKARAKEPHQYDWDVLNKNKNFALEVVI